MVGFLIVDQLFKQQELFKKLQEDFEYNLEILKERDQDLDSLEFTVQNLQKIIQNKFTIEHLFSTNDFTLETLKSRN